MHTASSPLETTDVLGLIQKQMQQLPKTDSDKGHFKVATNDSMFQKKNAMSLCVRKKFRIARTTEFLPPSTPYPTFRELYLPTPNSTRGRRRWQS
jgi:hypothetical protein